MRLIYILMVSFLFSSSLRGQKTFASRALDYHWIYTYSNWGSFVNKYVTKLDTPVYQFKGKNYYKFDQFKVADSGTKVFCLVDSTELLVMDYALNEADIISMNHGSRTFTMKVLSKRKVLVENDSLLYIVLKPMYIAGSFANIEWIESIGCISRGYHPINWFSTLGVYDVGYSLHCVTNNDTSILTQFGKNCALDNNLINPNKKWYTWASNNNGYFKFSVPYYFEDRKTTLFGKNYQTMNQKRRYVRYDSVEGKYFILANYNNGQELLVYSDKAKIGDTMAIYGTIPDTVIMIEYKWVEDEYRKVITTRNDVYLSGIGTVRHVMWNNHLADFPEFASGNVCFGESNIIRYHFSFFYQNREQCEITSSIQNANQEAMHIFPNPVKNLLNISSADRKEFRISNSYGALVLEGECEEKIDLGAFPKGIYFIELQSKNQTSHFKFLKEQ